MGARDWAGGESPSGHPTVSRGDESVGVHPAFAVCARCRHAPSGCVADGYGVQRTLQAHAQVSWLRGRSPRRPSMSFGAMDAGFADSQAFTYARRSHHRTGDFEDLTCAGGLGTFILNRLACCLRRRLSRATASCDFHGPASPTSRWGALPASSCSPGVVQRSPLHRFPCQSPRARLRVCACAPARRRRGGGCLGACAPPALGADLVVWLRPRRFLPLAGCRGFAPGADPGVRLVSHCVGSHLHSAPRAAFPPYEAFFPEGSCLARSRAPCGGSSCACCCQPALHRAPCRLVLRRCRRGPRGLAPPSELYESVRVAARRPPLLPWA